MVVQVSEDKLKLWRIALYGLNALCLIAGLAMLGGSIYLYVDKSDLLTYVYLMNAARPACILILTAVSTAIVIAIIGFAAAGMQSKILILVYCGLVVLAGLCAGAGLGCAVAGKVKYTDYIRWRMRDTILQFYGVSSDSNDTENSFITQKWDETQRKWYCCSVDDSSWGLYRSSKWFQIQPGSAEFDRPLVPQSCCTYNQYGQLIDLQKCQIWADGPPRKQSGPTLNEALIYRGCYTYGTVLLQRVSEGLIAISIILIIILICCLGVSLMTLVGILQNDSKQAVIRQTAYSVSRVNNQWNRNSEYPKIQNYAGQSNPNLNSEYQKNAGQNSEYQIYQKDPDHTSVSYINNSYA